MSGDGKELHEEVARLFREELDRHGYSFQDAMVTQINKITSLSNWMPWIPELPVEVQKAHTRIDFVYVNDRKTFYLVCECKRSNPGLSNWCFARTVFKSPHDLFASAYVESIVDIGLGVLRSNIKKLAGSDRLYQIALDVPGSAKGDKDGKGRGQIEEAATQVCRQLNGLVNFFYGHTALVQNQREKWVGLVPVILTTARLWITDFDLGMTNPESGKIGTNNFTVREVPWLWYQYHQSPGLKHLGPRSESPSDIEDILFREFVRPIAIVTPRGLQGFLSSSMWNI